MVEPLVRGFDSFAEVIADLQAQERDATAAMEPWQRDLAPGDRIAYAFQYEGGEEVTIYFELLTHEGPRLKASRMWGRGYSVHCLEGEIGSMWRCNALVTLTPVAWEAARCQGWPPIDFTLLGYERTT